MNPSAPGCFDGIERPYVADGAEFASETDGYTATRPPARGRYGLLRLVNLTISGGSASTTAMAESNEKAQFDRSELSVAAD